MVHTNGRVSAHEDRGLGFTTSVGVIFTKNPGDDEASRIARQVLALADKACGELPGHGGVDVRTTPSILESAHSDWTQIPMSIRTATQLTEEQCIDVAAATVAYLRDHISEIPELQAIREDNAPPVAVSGFLT